MPLVGTNFYGTQVQRTPYDDAEAQRAQGLDAWNMAQHQNDWQNQRHGQSRSDAWAMNRDNLNFGAWSHGQNMAQQAASAEAQRRMHEATLNQGMTLFDKSNALADARDARSWERGANMRTIAEEQAGWAGKDRAKALLDRQAQEDWDTKFVGDMKNQPLSGDALLQRLMTRPGGGMQMLPQLMSQQSQSIENTANRIMQMTNSNDPALRKQGLDRWAKAPPEVLRLIGEPPAVTELSTIAPSDLPTQTKRGLGRRVQQTTKTANAQDMGRYAATDPGQVESHIASLRAQVDNMAAQNPGVDPADIWASVKSKLDTGRASWQVLNLFGLIDTATQDANEAAIKALDEEYGAF